MLIFALTFSLLALNRHAAFRTNGFDLGNVNQAIWNSAHGRLLAFTNMAPVENRLALHVEPILLGFVPFYWLGLGGPRLLLMAQAVIVGLGAWPLYLIARPKVGPSGAVIISLAYLLYPALEAAVMYDFHAVTLAPTFLLFTFYRLEQALAKKSSWWWVALFTGLAMACKEDMGFVIGMLGFYVWLTAQRRRPALVLIGLGFGWSLLAVFGIQGLFGGNVQGDRYDWLAAALTQPALIWHHLWTQADLGSYLWGLFAPVAGLALLSPLTLLPMLPGLAENMLSSHGLQWRLEAFHYAAPLAPFVFIATAQALGRLRRVTRGNGEADRLILTALLTILLLASLSYHYWRGFSPLARPFQWAAIGPHERLGAAMAAEIEPEVPLFAPLTLNPHVSSRPSLHQTFDTITPADWLWVDVTALPNENSIQSYLRETLLSQYRPVRAEDGYLLLEPGAAEADLPPAFYTFARPPGTINPQYPLSAHFGPDLELIGYDLLFDRAEAVQVITYWQPHAPLPADLKPILYLLDEQGVPLGATETDKPPATLVWYPIAQWQAGEVVTVHFNLLNWDTRLRAAYGLGLGVSTAADPFEAAARLAPGDIQSDFAPYLAADGTILKLAYIEQTAGLAEGGPQPRRTTAPIATRRLQADLGGQIRLLGYDEPQIKDNQFHVTLYWQALTEPLPDYVRFVHVVANGSLQTQADSRPVHNRYPTRLWQTGEYVIDPITITLTGPLPPDYVLHVGFYDPATVTRLPTNLATPDYVLIAPP